MNDSTSNNRDTTGRADLAPATTSTSEKPTPTRAQASEGGRKGGRSARHVSLIGLGDLAPARIDLRSTESLQSLLEAIGTAVALGRTSSLVATTLIQVVRTARELLADGKDDRVRELEARLERLVVR